MHTGMVDVVVQAGAVLSMGTWRHITLAHGRVTAPASPRRARTEKRYDVLNALMERQYLLRVQDATYDSSILLLSLIPVRTQCTLALYIRLLVSQREKKLHLHNSIIYA